MNKKFAILLVFVSLLSLQGAFAQVNIGYTNPAKILSQLPEVGEVDKQIEALINQKDEELAKKAADLQQVFADYETVSADLSEDEKKVREEELMQLNQQFEEERAGMLDEVRQKRNELMAPIIQKMNAAMESVAEELGLDLILNEGTSNGDAIIFFAQSEKLDITNQIIAKIN